MLNAAFFDRDSQRVAKALVGKVIRRRRGKRWLAAAIVETEAYYRREKGSHASLGRTPSREALFMPPGTIYMYYSRGADSLNISCRGAGNAVLIKSGLALEGIRQMQRANPLGDRTRPKGRLCSGQTLLCKSLSLRVPDWNQKVFEPDVFFIEDVGRRPKLIQTRRLGIPKGRDEHLMYRFIDYERVVHATQNPLTNRSYEAGVDYRVISSPRS